MVACNRPECGRGTVDRHGFCTECGLEPLPPERVRAHASPRPAPTGVAQVRPDPWYGLALADDLPAPDAAGTEAQPDSHTLAEAHRFCANPACGRPVGRAHDGRAGRTAGFCSRCGTRFDFAQVDGLVIAGRYQVRRLLGQGSYGAAYLAHDRNLDTDVVVKKLQTARSQGERDVLVELRHDAIVRILGYEEEGEGERQHSYLVLEYLPGSALTARRGDRLDTLLAHGVRILQALDYLHARELLHCDVKPLNIIRFQEPTPARTLDRVRLIDFGAVRAVGDRSPMTEYTDGYAPLPDDAEYAEGPTPGFDLYGLGRTLQELCRARLTDTSTPGVHSLKLLLERATHAGGPRVRFTSARQFGEQLSGVIRQIVAAPPVGRQVRRASALFGAFDASLHGGLGAARPLDHWADAKAERACADGRARDIRLTLPPLFSTPGPHTIAAALPMPLGDPDDRTATQSAQAQLAECRRLLSTSDTALAERTLQAVPLPGGHWLRAWYAGLIALRREDVQGATEQFTAVRGALPGELIPQLALGLCAEYTEEYAVAKAHYSAVFATTPALGAAAFGLARVLHLTDATEEAVRVLGDLAKELAFEHEARAAEFRLGLALYGSDADDAADLEALRQGLEKLDVDEASHAALSTELAHAAFLRSGDRLALSEEVRTLARHALTEKKYFALVDLANQLRPEPQWPWLTSVSGT